MVQVKSNDKSVRSLSILVVDDDELNRRMMQLLLKRDGHSVEFASNGQEALDAIKAKSYDIILMDLQMPVMDGVEASRRIREWEGDARRTFIVALTASYMPERGRELYEVGIDNYIAKPFDLEHLRNILQYGVEHQTIEVVPLDVVDLPQSSGIDFQIGVQRVGGDPEVYKELLSDFVHELPDKQEKLWFHLKNRDFESLYRAAHNLKGVSANLGALQLSEHAGRLEKQVMAGYNEAVEGLMNDISIMIRTLMESAFNFLAAKN